MSKKNNDIMPPVSKIDFISISDIDFGDRIREEYNVDALAESINENGQLVPISVIDRGDGLDLPYGLPYGRYKLKFGGRRIKAMELLGKNMVRAEIFSVDNDCAGIRQEGAENFDRKEHAFSEAIKYTKIRMEELNKNNDVKGRKDDIVAREIGWSRRKLSDALFVEHNACDEVKKAIGTENGLSIFGASKIAKLPKKQQIQALNDAKNFYDTESDDLSKYNISRRKKKRQEKFNNPEKYKPHPVYHIVRVAPNWESELFTDIAETPVLNYMKEKQAYCVIEVPALHLDRAFSLLPLWGLCLDSLITICNPSESIGIGVALQHPRYFIIAKNCDGFDIIPRNIVNVFRVPAVLEHIDDSISFLDHIFPGTEKRICMSSLKKTGRWISFKTSYGFNADDESVFEPEKGAANEE